MPNDTHTPEQMNPPTCTCHTTPCYCQEEYDDSELATCPDCGVRAPWPDAWDVGGMEIGIDEQGAIVDDEEDGGRVWCPACGEIVVTNTAYGRGPGETASHVWR